MLEAQTAQVWDCMLHAALSDYQAEGGREDLGAWGFG